MQIKLKKIENAKNLNQLYNPKLIILLLLDIQIKTLNLKYLKFSNII